MGCRKKPGGGIRAGVRRVKVVALGQGEKSAQQFRQKIEGMQHDFIDLAGPDAALDFGTKNQQFTSHQRAGEACIQPVGCAALYAREPPRTGHDDPFLTGRQAGLFDLKMP